MGDELGFERGPRLSELYGHRRYIEPEYGPWESWYAWYPVRRVTWRSFGVRDLHIRVGRWEWRTNLLRRKVLSKTYDFSDRKKAQWEYVTMEEVLRWE